MSDTGKFIFVFVAGIEGCGHHGLNPVISQAYEHAYPEGTIIREWRKFKSACNRLWCKSHLLPFTRTLAKNKIQKIFSEQARLAKKNGQIRMLIEDNSFPAGKHRDLNRQWQLNELYELVKPYADEIYFFGLYRHPIASVFSHKEWDGGIIPHAQLMERFLCYVNQQLSYIAPSIRQTVFYDDLIEDQDGIVKKLSEYLQLSAIDIEHGLKAIRKSNKNWRTDLPENEQQKLKAIFSRHESNWPILACAPRASGAHYEH